MSHRPATPAVLGFIAAVIAALGVSAVLAVGASAAAPQPTYRFEGGYGHGQFISDAPANDPLAGPPLAVDPATGDVASTATDDSRVKVYPAGIASGAPKATVDPQGVSQPSSLVYSATGNALYVYVNGEIRRYTKGGTAAAPTFTPTLGFSSPPQGTDGGQIGFSGQMTIDPTNGNLLVLSNDFGRVAVQRFNGLTGAYIDGFDGSASGGTPLANALSIAADAAGTIYVVDQAFPDFRVRHFNADGTPLADLAGVPNPVRVAVDRGSNTVAVGSDPVTSDDATEDDPLFSIYRFSGATRPTRTTLPDGGPTGLYGSNFRARDDSGFAGQLQAMSIDPRNGRLAVGVSANGQTTRAGIAVLASDTAPGVELNAPTQVEPTSIRVSGTVTPGARTAAAHFEYSTDGGLTFTSTPDQNIAAGNTARPVEAEIEGLLSNSDVTVRLRATSSTGVDAVTEPRTVRTATAAPLVTTGGSSDVSATKATVEGLVNPQGGATTYHFEYGTTTGYGSRAPFYDGQVGAGRTQRRVSQTLTGLTPGATYHYRLVATNAGGTVSGADRTFVARDAAVRGFEQVTPVNKGAGVLRRGGYARAAADGSGITYSTRASFAAVPAGSGPALVRYGSLRDTLGWSTHSLDLKQVAPSPYAILFQTSIGSSEDGRYSLSGSNVALAPGAVDGQNNLYVLDIASGAVTLVATSPDNQFATSRLGPTSGTFLDGTSDFSTLLLQSAAALTPNATAGNNNIYRWTRSGGLELAQILPDDSAAPFAGVNPSGASAYALSADGRQVYFTDYFTVYARRDGVTKAIAVSQRNGASADPVPATQVSATPDGSKLFFSTSGVDGLTDDAPDGTDNLYRYDTASGRIAFVTSAPGGSFVVSDDGSTAYALGAGTVFRKGQTSSLPAGPNPLAFDSQMSPDGRYLVFVSTDNLTQQDTRNPQRCTGTSNSPRPNGECREVFAYDAEAGTLTCLSCPRDDARSLGDSAIGVSFNYYQQGRYKPRVIDSSGTIYFDTPNPLVAGDKNGLSDVYAYRDGQLALMSRGLPGKSSAFADATPTGSDVFMISDDSIVGQDTDDQDDLYDSRIGGGIAGQNPPGAPAACSSGECAEPTTGPAAEPVPASQLPAVKAAKPRTATATFSKKTSVKGTAVTVSIKASDAGALKLSGNSYLATAVKRLRRGGSYAITAKLTKKGRAALRRKKRLKVAVRATYVPRVGRSTSARLVATFTDRKGAR